jgi:hypothetical protein
VNDAPQSGNLVAQFMDLDFLTHDCAAQALDLVGRFINQIDGVFWMPPGRVRVQPV